MVRRRLEYDNDGSPISQLLNLADEYQRAARDGQWGRAAGCAHRIEDLAQRLTDQALLAADRAQPRQRHAIARAMGLVHGTVNHRIRRELAREAREGRDTPETEEDTMLNQLIADHAERYGLRRELVESTVAAIRSKTRQGWDPAHIAEWCAGHVGADSPYAKKHVISQVVAALR